jgi:colicin import membrane protein
MSRRQKSLTQGRWRAIALSVLLHTGIVAAAVYGWFTWKHQPPPVTTIAIEATVVDERALKRIAPPPKPEPEPPPPEPVPEPEPPVEEQGPPKPDPAEIERKREEERLAQEKLEQEKQAQEKETARREKRKRAARGRRKQAAGEKRRAEKAAADKAAADKKAQEKKKAEEVAAAKKARGRESAAGASSRTGSAFSSRRSAATPCANSAGMQISGIRRIVAAHRARLDSATLGTAGRDVYRVGQPDFPARGDRREK